VLGEVTIPGFPFKFSAFPDELSLEAPFLGEHNDEILMQDLGRSRDTVAGLYQKEVLYKEDK
jgi:hypothetical protein